ncbi:MAG: hypothetical protein U0931_16345 [Vulcanimicrobiota bacterium]
MEIAASRLPPIARLRPLTPARCAEVPGEQLKRHHKYYNDVLATVDLLRSERYQLPPDLIGQATWVQAEDDEETAIHKLEYSRLHKSLAREMTRGSRQLDQLGQGSHVLSDSVHILIEGQRVATYRSDGSQRHADLQRQSLLEISDSGVPEFISRRGSTMFSGPIGLPLPPQKAPVQVGAMPDHFSLVIEDQSVQVSCRTLPSGLVELDLGGHRLQVSFQEIKAGRHHLEKLAYSYLQALRRKISPENLAQHYVIQRQPQAPPKISGNLKASPVPPPAQPKTTPLTPKKSAPPPPKKEAIKAEAAPKEVKAELKPRPPSPPLRIQLASGAKLSSTKGRLRKARKLAARVTKYDPHPATQSVKEQVARRLAILTEEQLAAFDHALLINPAGLPPREGWLNEEFLYQQADEDPLLLLILELLS